MNCPKCEGTLYLKNGEGHLGFICDKCEGIWLSNKYIQSIKYTYNFDQNAFIKKLSESYKNTNHPCPICKTDLNNSLFKKIELEWCNSCTGVWFDKHELKTLISKYKNPSNIADEVISRGFDLMFILSIFSN